MGIDDSYLRNSRECPRCGYAGLDYQLGTMRPSSGYAGVTGRASHMGDYSGGSGSKYSKMGEDKS
jgi:hypothetical protein